VRSFIYSCSNQTIDKFHKILPSMLIKKILKKWE
jgi:hypothetical protein